MYLLLFGLGKAPFGLRLKRLWARILLRIVPILACWTLPSPLLSVRLSHLSLESARRLACREILFEVGALVLLLLVLLNLGTLEFQGAAAGEGSVFPRRNRLGGQGRQSGH